MNSVNSKKQTRFNWRHMRKRLGTSLVLMFFSSFVMGQSFRISLAGNNTEFCSGYGSENMAQVQVEAAPSFLPPANTGIVYNWYVITPQGSRMWNTPVDRRVVPLPWSGRYSMWAQISFIDKTTLRTYASFRSNTITFSARECYTQISPLTKLPDH